MKISLLTRGGAEIAEAAGVFDLIPPELKFSTKRKNKRVYQYADDFICLDTETSHSGEDCAWIYQWAASVGDTFVIGRRPSEFVQLLEKLRDF